MAARISSGPTTVPSQFNKTSSIPEKGKTNYVAVIQYHKVIMESLPKVCIAVNQRKSLTEDNSVLPLRGRCQSCYTASRNSSSMSQTFETTIKCLLCGTPVLSELWSVKWLHGSIQPYCWCDERPSFMV